MYLYFMYKLLCLSEYEHRDELVHGCPGPVSSAGDIDSTSLARLEVPTRECLHSQSHMLSV